MGAIVPLFGSGTLGKSSNITAQKRINLYAEMSPDPDKTPMAFYSRPGLVDAVTKYAPQNPANAQEQSGPYRAIFSYEATYIDLWTGIYKQSVTQFARGIHSAVMDSKGNLYATYTFGGPTWRTSSGKMASAVSGSYVFVVDGVSCYSSPLTTIFTDHYADANVPIGATSVCFIAGRFVFNSPLNPGRFVWTEVGANTFNALDYATAESSPDALVGVSECRGDLVLFGAATTEFWRPVATTAIFQRVGGSGIQWGLAALHSVSNWNDGLIFLGRNTLGNRQVCMMNGYQVKVVSTPDVEFDISNDAAPAAASGYTFTLGGHSWYVLNLQNKTWAYDITTNRWDEWQTDGGRFAGELCGFVFGDTLVTDYRDGRLYYFDDEAYTDSGEPMMREITSRHVFSNLDRLTASQLALDCETGVGITSGQGSDPKIMMQISKDGGHTFGNEMWRSLGAMGNYLTRLTWNRLGRARDWVFRFRVSDPVKVVILNASIELDK